MTIILKQTLTCESRFKGVTQLVFPSIHPTAAVWLINLAQPNNNTEADLLSLPERAIATRFVHDLDRQRYINAHCALRNILARTVGKPAHSLEFTNGPHGKPLLVNHPQCAFNLSHSGDWGVVALSDTPRQQGIGVDIEVMRNIDNLDALAGEVFTPTEEKELRLVSEQKKTAAFLHGWVRKEAVLKALGTGLSLSPKLVHAGLAAKTTTVTIQVSHALHQIHLQSMYHPAGFSVALALT
jgi:4'-phosphopantetheinyl transferase